MMKISDVKSATALVIQGYLRACEAGVGIEKENLREGLAAILAECDDWAENNDEAIPVDLISVYFNGPRTPFNVRSAIESLKQEYKDLMGKPANQEKDWNQLVGRE